LLTREEIESVTLEPRDRDDVRREAHLASHLVCVRFPADEIVTTIEAVFEFHNRCTGPKGGTR
jgi:hypothetical protein